MRSVGFTKLLRGVLLVLLVAVLTVSVWAGNSSTNSPLAGLNLDRYTVKNWTTSDGLPAGHIQALCQTRDGYLWIGTRHGLGRFDGTEFKVVTYLNCFCLAEENDGTLWAGTSS